MNTKRVLVISTGGTIAMTNSTGAGITPTLSGMDLVRAAPELARKADLEVVPFSTKPGASLSLEELIEIAELIDSRASEQFSGAVVVQGTDTIEETAFVLDLRVNSGQPVVVTGAMRSWPKGLRAAPFACCQQI
jgi:L-asparaginase